MASCSRSFSSSVPPYLPGFRIKARHGGRAERTCALVHGKDVQPAMILQLSHDLERVALHVHEENEHQAFAPT
eukprot:451471-Hanusia_phi.AAC.2